MPNKGVPVNLDRKGRKEHMEYHEDLEVNAKQALEMIEETKDAADYATEQGNRAKEYSDNIDEVMKDGPVQTVNGKTGQVSGLAEQVDLDKTNEQLAETNHEINARRTISKKRAIITIETDDALIEDYTDLFPFLQEHGVVASMAVPPGKVGRPERMSWEQIKELVNDYGWDITSHTVNETILDEVFLGEAEFELKESKEMIEEQGLKADHFTYPNGRYNNDVMDLAKKYYKSTGTTQGGVNLLPVQSHRLRRANPLLTDLELLKYYVDYAIENNGYLILFTHGNEFAGRNFDGTSNDGIVRDRLDSIITYAKSKSVDFMNREDAWNEAGNLIDLGNYGNDSFPGNFVVSKRGDMVLNDRKLDGKPLVSPTDHNITPQTPIEEFDVGNITHTQIDTSSAREGFPEGLAGKLVTDYTIKWNKYPFQEYHILGQNRVYRRVWDNGWTPFEIVYGRSLVSPSGHSITPETPIEYFSNGNITHTQIDGARSEGFPENTAGELVTNRTIEWSGYPFQEYNILRKNKVYRRVWDNGWKPFEIIINGNIVEGYRSVGNWSGVQINLHPLQTQPDNNYAVLFAPTWNSGAIWASNITPEGFFINWEKKPEDSASLGYRLIRTF